ncbi:hypothetical protein BB559_006243 [Furculomyces boomerangus]|uniref:Ceramide very long chain fatty acid hydroxylase n=1 Tax=Furculomyces boomerangus TaxID=61424 RepID=A0A2T9Y440_9FUNG|nr:hypothetical protein BB559_006243 [Furculomyces boomerangus]
MDTDSKPILFTRSEVSIHNSEASLWVIHSNKVYDITPFVSDHPGGAEWLCKFGGQDITSVMPDRDLHNHSKQAYHILEKLVVGEIIHKEQWTHNAKDSAATDTRDIKLADPSPDFIDPNKPIFTQIWNSSYTREFYLQQVHVPRHIPGPAVFFDNKVLEIFTKTPWYVIPMYWIPIMIVVWNIGLQYTTPDVMYKNYVLGLFVWTLLEYMMHRFIFHFDENIPEGTMAQVVHFTLHGFHHFLPMDSMRLVMPPVLSSTLAIILYYPLSCIIPPGIMHGLTCGVLTMYIVYDETHYWLHHGFFKWNVVKRLKSYHLEHHYRIYKLGFGITSDFWDRVFGTTFEKEPK